MIATVGTPAEIERGQTSLENGEDVKTTRTYENLREGDLLMEIHRCVGNMIMEDMMTRNTGQEYGGQYGQE